MGQRLLSALYGTQSLVFWVKLLLLFAKNPKPRQYPVVTLLTFQRVTSNITFSNIFLSKLMRASTLLVLNGTRDISVCHLLRPDWFNVFY